MARCAPVNPNDPPSETLHTLRPKPETRPVARSERQESSEAFEPRYVEIPRRRRVQIAAERNLKWGLAVLLLALGLLGAALIVNGARALLPIVVCLITFTILWAMARLRVFHQRNGVFFATAIICLLGSIIPLVERAYIQLDRMVHAPVADASAATLAAVNQATEITPESEPPALVEAFKIKPPVDAAIDLVRVTDDIKVMVDRKPYLLRSGDTFALDDVKDGQVTFRANDLRLSLPEQAVELLPPRRPEPAFVNAAPVKPADLPPPPPRVSDQEPAADITARANSEVMRRYPKVGVKDSPENQLFVERFNEFKKDRPEFFDEPEWPIYLAEGLAKEQGWQRAQ